MSLLSSVDESKWKLQGGGSNPDGYESTFQRKQADGSYVTKKLSVTYLEVTAEYKHYALTEGACTTYITAHPELALQYSRQNEFSDGYTLSKRTISRTNFAYSIVDVSEAGS